MVTTLKQARRIIEKNMVENGTMARIDERKAKHEMAAKQLGFSSAQAAFNKMGKEFLVIANTKF